MRSSFFGCRGQLMEYKNCPHNNSLEVHFCNPFSTVCTLTFVFLIKMEHVWHNVDMFYVRWRDYTEIRNQILLCMNLQKRLDWLIKKSIAWNRIFIARTLLDIYIEPLIVGHMWQSYCTITKLLILWHKWY